MADNTSPNFTIQDATVLIRDLGKIGGSLDIFCCATEVSFSTTVESEEIFCNRVKGVTDRFDSTPRAVLSITELNFNETVMERALNLSSSYATAPYQIRGNGLDPSTTPVSLAQVDGPYTPTYTGGDAIIALGNGFIISESIFAWTYNATTAVFTTTAITVDYASADTNLATGEIEYNSAADVSPIYYTYKYNPQTTGTKILVNPFTVSSNTEIGVRIIHEHATDDLVFVYDFWRGKIKPESELALKTASGDKVISITFQIDIFGDEVNHPGSPLYQLRIFSTTDWEATTPFYACLGSVLTTPLVE